MERARLEALAELALRRLARRDQRELADLVRERLTGPVDVPVDLVDDEVGRR